MTELEIMNIFEELYGAGLGNAPKDPAAAVKVWLDFFGGDDALVIGKAVGLHLRKSEFWPTPRDIIKIKERAEWLSEVEQQKFREAQQQKLIQQTQQAERDDLISLLTGEQEPPKAPAVKLEVYCTGAAVCPYYEMDVCGGTKTEHAHCSI